MTKDPNPIKDNVTNDSSTPNSDKKESIPSTDATVPSFGLNRSSEKSTLFSPDSRFNNRKAKEGPKEIAPGSIINDRFELIALLGQGGMGVVYKALDKRKQEARDRNPYVAIKILGENFKQHPQAFIALQREARKSQDLAHPNIITVYDFDRDGDTVYMTMELLDGTPLDQTIRDNLRGVGAKKGFNIIRGIAQGLAYAHSKGIVHSDLKPSNIFLSRNDVVKVLDFGIARAVVSASTGEASSEGTQDQTVFDAGELGGLTPAYASPEMFLGATPHTSDDVFALGLVAYEVLIGEHPYQRKRSSDASEQQLKVKRIKGLKSTQWRAISGALELRRESRIQSAQEFLNKAEGLSAPLKLAMLSMTLAAAIVVAVVLLVPKTTGPEIAFNDLPEQQQQNISEALNNGNAALNYNDYNGALFHFNNAYELHPKNPDAVQGLEKVIDKFIDNLNIGRDPKKINEQLYQIDALLQYSSLAEHSVLLSTRDQLKQALVQQQ